MRLCIYVEFDDESDLDWIRERAVAAVQYTVEGMKDEDPYRLDSSKESLSVDWDTEEE